MSTPPQPASRRSPRGRWACSVLLVACTEQQPATPTVAATVAPTQAPLPAEPAVASEPTPQTQPESAPARAERLELSFVGDIVLGRYRIENGDWHYREMATPAQDPFAEVAQLLAADVIVGNLESPLIRELPEHSPIKHKNRFGAGTSQLPQLAGGGFNVVSLANNHYYDLGVSGQLEGPQMLTEAGIFAVGASREQDPLFRVETLEISGWRVGFLAFSTVRNHVGTRSGPKLPLLALSDIGEQLLPLIRAARADHDLLIAMVHWGEEYAAEIRTTQRIAAHKLLGAGVDLLIGHHPHVLQAIERHASDETRDGLIAYSLGNFLFPRNDGGAELSAILSATYVDQGEGQRPCLAEARVDPIYMSRKPHWRPVPAPHFQGTKVHKRLRELSRERHTKLSPASTDDAPPPGENTPGSDALFVTQLRACEDLAQGQAQAQAQPQAQASSSKAASVRAEATDE